MWGGMSSRRGKPRGARRGGRRKGGPEDGGGPMRAAPARTEGAWAIGDGAHGGVSVRRSDLFWAKRRQRV